MPTSKSIVCLACCLLFAEQSALERGAAAFRQHDFAAAETALRQAVRENPSSAIAQKLLGLTYSAQEKYAQAQEPLRRACAFNPREENACYYLGRLSYTLNRYEESREAFTIALKHPGPHRGRVLLGLALTLEALGQDDLARQNYKAAVEQGETQALIDYAHFLARRGQPTEALALLRRANATEEAERLERSLKRGAVGASATTVVPIQFQAQPLPMVVRNGAQGEKHLIETMPGGVAVFDFDNDGWPDIFVANGATSPTLQKSDPSFHNRLFRNNHDGTFSDVTDKAGMAGAGYSMGVAAADYDNDGWVDLFVAGVHSNTLYRNRGDGTFEDVTADAGLTSDGRWSVAAGWFDYDNDGLLDLFVVRYVDWKPQEERYCGLPKDGYRTYCHPEHYSPLPNALYHNEGRGKFRDVSASSGIGAASGKGMGVAFGDYDGDGLLDVFVANDSVPNFLFHNQGQGKFEETALAAGVALNGDGAARSSMGVDFRDFDNDGREDLFVTDLTNERFLLYRNAGEQQFVDASALSRIAALSLPWTGWSAGLFDLNNDGRKDIFVAGGHVMDNAELTSSRQSRQPNLVFVNRGGGVFAVQQLPGVAFHRGAAFGDFDRDGRVDVVVTRLNESPLVLRNKSAGSGHWIALRLEGTKSNRDGIGAKVHVVSRSSEQWNRVTTSVGYAGSSDRTVHFGLGPDTIVRSLEIEWPSGRRQKLSNLSADQAHTIREP